MRFIFVDRIVGFESGRSLESLKNVSASEDVFEDHFPGCPIMPGALIVEAFDQAAQLLVGMSHAFQRLGRLVQLSRATFRRLVRPGDQLRIRCERRDGDSERWTVDAIARVDGRPVATATLLFVIEDVAEGDASAERARRLRDRVGVLRDEVLERVLPGAPS